jgi:hypothetical protein
MSPPPETEIYNNYGSTTMPPIHLDDCAQAQSQFLLIYNKEVIQEPGIAINMTLCV